MKQFLALLGVAFLLSGIWVGLVLTFMYPYVGLPVLGATIAITVIAAKRAERRSRPVAIPAPAQWRVWDEPLPEQLSETELDMRARHGGPDEAFFHNAHVLTTYPWAGGIPYQRDRGLN